jgi:hypothetical protein
MSPILKILIGIAATSGMTWINHGPLGNGEALVNRLEKQAKSVVVATEIPGIEVRLGRDPLARLVTLSGQADTFQREGQGELKGINDRVGAIDGISGVRWSDEPEKKTIPLFLETLLQTILAYLIGLGVTFLFWGRPKREGYL